MSAWHQIEESKPEDGVKIIAMASLPTGPLVRQYGFLENGWFCNFGGAMSSPSCIVKWRLATPEEIAHCENEANWRG